jgi:hypothetical protein
MAKICAVNLGIAYLKLKELGFELTRKKRCSRKSHTQMVYLRRSQKLEAIRSTIRILAESFATFNGRLA